MGTHSRLIISRVCKPSIYLWMHFDGYFDGVGNVLASHVEQLLSKYTLEHLKEMIDAIDQLDETTKEACGFDAEDLTEFIEGKSNFKFDDDDNIEYEYYLDISKKTLTGKRMWDDEVRTLTFHDIKDGKSFMDVEPCSPAKRTGDDGLTVAGLIALLQKKVKENPRIANMQVWREYDGSAEPISNIEIDIGNKYQVVLE